MRTRAQRGLQRHSALRGVNPWLLTSQVDARLCVRLPAAVDRCRSRGVLPSSRGVLQAAPDMPLTRGDRWFSRSTGRVGKMRRDPQAAVPAGPERTASHPRVGSAKGSNARRAVAASDVRRPRPPRSRARQGPALPRARVRIRSLSAGSAARRGHDHRGRRPGAARLAASDGLSRWRTVLGQDHPQPGPARQAPRNPSGSGSRRPRRRCGRRPHVSRRRSSPRVNGVRGPGPSWSAGPGVIRRCRRAPCCPGRAEDRSGAGGPSAPGP